MAFAAVLTVAVAFGETSRPVPGANLLERMRSGVDVIGIVHFTVNTFTDREWGYGSESPNDFNPTDFSADQIVKACCDGGIKGLVIVAKHHDGFCLWPTKTTEHNITKSPFWRGTGNGERGTGRDYVKEMEQACRKYGLKFGVYCSPWDRNNAAYATPEYVKTYHAQVEELNDGRYGEIFEMWFDGANGGDGYYGGAWEKRSIGVAREYYRMAELLARVRELQPKVCFFGGGDFKWPGNERGMVPPESGGTRDDGTFQIYEADFPLRPGWFYHESQDGFSRSGEFLMKIYLRTVGNGATMDIGISPDRRGRLTDEDVSCLKRFAEIREAFFSKPVANASSPFNVIVISEDIEHGERVDEWRVLLDGRELAKGGKIGTKRMRVLDAPVSGKELKLEVVKGDARAGEIKVELFLADEGMVRKVMASEEPKRPPAPFELKGVLTSRKPGELVYMMKSISKVSSLVVSPDAESLDGTPVVFRLAYSTDGKSWSEDETEYRLDNVAANPVPQNVALSKSVNVKYLRLRPVRTLKGGADVHLSGLEFVP
ncbi:MAG: alpha-L-fucosidase [Kiritimatiellae bacterium]|nr:alpha-L-fucosidase [Kiritimatiellia bacterium]